MSIERNSGNTYMASCSFIDIPRIISGIGSQMGREMTQSRDHLLVQGTEKGDIMPLLRMLVE
jgi:hypothetical protein